jgi:hypothetical protein
MLFFSKSGSKELDRLAIPDISCSYCGSKGTLDVTVIGNFALFLFIPMYPLANKGVVYCSNCKHTTFEHEQKGEIRKRVKEVCSGTKRPIWFLSGSLLFGLLIGKSILLLVVDSYSEKKRLENLQPQVGQVFYRKEDELYASLGISRVTVDSVFFHKSVLFLSSSEAFTDSKIKTKFGLEDVFESEEEGISRLEFTNKVASHELQLFAFRIKNMNLRQGKISK